MRRFVCDTCGAEVRFGDDRCSACSTGLGYLPSACDLRSVRAADGTYRVVGDAAAWWRCLNHAWGCNWMVAAGTDTSWCTSCGLTRGRPDTAVPDAVAAWASAEATKRRLVHQLLSLGLPLEPTTSGEPRLVFDLVAIPEGGGVTGHRDGVVTLDLREVDDAYRETVRRQFGEPFRTVIGHLRHEVGHHFWHTLLRDAATLGEFRRLFGDERADYRVALAAHHDAPIAPVSPGFVTSYAMAHPLEDWAETFAHYLHLRDGLETAGEHGIGPPVRPDEADAAVLLDAWSRVIGAVNRIEEGLGQRPVYPIAFVASRFDPMVVDKFSFIHRQVRARGPS